jgi:predicted regulator of Ras-like GTPase activity (Roadblock/LC7/MglB family)
LPVGGRCGRLTPSGGMGTYERGGMVMALDKGLDWLLDDLTERVEHIRHALVLSNDGLVTGASSGLAREDAEHLAAVSSGLHSLARGSGRHFNAGRARQTMVEFDDALLLVTAAGDGSCLCVFSAAEADVGLVAYEMTLLVNRVGEHLGVAARQPRRTSVKGE